MEFISKAFEKLWFRISLVSILLVIVYSPVLFLQQTVNPDAQMILGNLNGFDSLGGYFDGLINFKTLDFQPIRDLSFFLDLKIYEKSQINTIIKFNLIIWIISVQLIYSILRNLFPENSPRIVLVVTLLFALDPLFSTSISWGMARKHLLSFVFILAATNEVFKKERSSLKIITFYSLSILSQPISLLWPLWMMVFDYSKNLFDKKKMQTYGILLLLMVGMTIVNFKYYDQSEVYRSIYPKKAEDLFNLLDRLKVVGHYFYQMILPYRLAFNYHAGGIETYIGLFVATILSIYGYLKLDRRTFLTWLIFILLPLSIVSTDAGLLSDTYLLVPSVGLLLLIINLVNRMKLPRFGLPVGIVLILFWALRSHGESQAWKNSLSFASKDFQINENCTSALLNARMSYLENEMIESDLKQFIASNNCLNMDPREIKSHFRLNEFLTVSIYMLYYESDFNRDQKILGLTKLSQSHYLASFFLAAIALEENQVVIASQHISKVISTSQKDLPLTYEPIVARKILPFCMKNPELNCTTFMGYFATQETQLYY